MMRMLTPTHILRRTEKQMSTQTGMGRRGSQKKRIDRRFFFVALFFISGCAIQPPTFFSAAEDDDDLESEGDSDIGTLADSDTALNDGPDTVPNEDPDTETSLETDTVDPTETGVDTGDDDDDDLPDSCPNSTTHLTLHKEFHVLDCRDDAEESISGDNNFPEGSVYLDSSDLEMIDDAKYLGSKQIVGIRFAEVNIPKAALVKEAYIEFVSDNYESAPTDLRISVEASDNAKSFSDSPFNISKRSRVASSIDWDDVSPWEEGYIYRTPDISSAIQEVLCRSRWKERNAIVVIIEGRGVREAVSYDQSPRDAASLHVTYSF